MADLGGIKDKSEVKILILYILKSINKGLTISNISDILIKDGLADYFVIAEAVGELTASEHIEKLKKGKEFYYFATQLGFDTSDELYQRLPFTVREKAISSALEILAVINRNSQILTRTTEVKGGFEIECKIQDEEYEIMKISLYVPNQLQAETVAKHFKKKPEIVYKKIISLLANDITEE